MIFIIPETILCERHCLTPRLSFAKDQSTTRRLRQSFEYKEDLRPSMARGINRQNPDFGGLRLCSFSTMNHVFNVSEHMAI